MKKPVVLTFCDYYLPGFRAGGPLRTIGNMVEHLGDGLSFRIVTRDHDAGVETRYANCQPGTWQRVGKAEVMYLPPERLTLPGLRDVINRTDHDVMYLNSFFSPVFTIMPLVLRRLRLIRRRPVVLAPRGEFSPAALRSKRMKKVPYVRAARAMGLYNDLIWQASSEMEEGDIHGLFGRKASVHIALNLASPVTDTPMLVTAHGKRPGRLKAVFISRVCHSKNLDGALQMLHGLSGEVELHVYGPKEDPAYWQRCRQLIDRLPANVKVEDHGLVPNDRVPSIMREHDLFLFPTHGENFGHVILESLLAGCPVLLSDRTPWHGLREKGAGWNLPLDRPELFRAALQQCIDMDNRAFQEMSARAIQHGRSVADDRKVVERNRLLFQLAAEGSLRG